MVLVTALCVWATIATIPLLRSRVWGARTLGTAVLTAIALAFLSKATWAAPVGEGAFEDGWALMATLLTVSILSLLALGLGVELLGCGAEAWRRRRAQHIAGLAAQSYLRRLAAGEAGVVIPRGKPMILRKRQGGVQ
jgi:hypothetical protein